jgi:selenocysteine insertion sequence-binding protein 2
VQVESAGGLDDHVDAIIRSSTEAGVPVVYALSRKKLGDVYGTRKRMSAIAVLELNGVRELVEQISSLAQEGQRMWQDQRGRQVEVQQGRGQEEGQAEGFDVQQ